MAIMTKYLPHLAWLQSQNEKMLELVEKWANINSGSYNLAGLELMASTLKQDFQVLGGKITEIPLPPTTSIDSLGNAIEERHGINLHIEKYPNAPFKVFLGGHMDTVYGSASSFQNTERIAPNILKGPGVIDMKGGLAIMLKALECLEKSPFAGKIGWEILINCDEETGSTASAPLFATYAKRNQIGLIFEPSFSDGSLVNARKGSSNYTIVSKGKAAHVGRDFHQGKNAITALVRLLLKAEAFNDPQSGIIVNIGSITGGGPINVVPDLAIGKINVRMEDMHQQRMIHAAFEKIVNDANHSGEGIFLLHQQITRPPKPFDSIQKALFEKFAACAKELNTEIKWKATGGVCDGNLLAAEGLPVIDTLGAIGGNMHTDEEFLLIDSLVQRATLVALFLMKLSEEKR